MHIGSVLTRDTWETWNVFDDLKTDYGIFQQLREKADADMKDYLIVLFGTTSFCPTNPKIDCS